MLKKAGLLSTMDGAVVRLETCHVSTKEAVAEVGSFTSLEREQVCGFLEYGIYLFSEKYTCFVTVLDSDGDLESWAPESRIVATHH